MSSGLERAKASAAAEEEKFKKLLKAIKKGVAKEFLWVLAILLLSVPLSLVLKYGYDKLATIEIKNTVTEILEGNSMALASYMVSIAGIYFTRMTMGAIQTVLKKEKK